ncbi:glycosyltransferase family 2 protein [Erythrobacter sp. NFXS35]|uniref:glycosyltransferase family 2 protein n=1 Tax=Erythrobacter sp. NFXS35 TaxID=2818436 RepID=UPI0032DEBFAA
MTASGANAIAAALPVAVPLASKADLLVVFATHNGADWIEQVLAAYAQQEGADFPWALVAVDNASTDSTRAILDRWQSRLPLVVLDEPRAGKNIALNRALASIDNPACDFVFTDDDAVPAPDFILRWKEVLDARPGHGLFGGSVAPDFDAVDDTVPRRYRPWHAEIYARNCRASGPITPEAIFGPNMAVWGELIRRGFRFDENIGPSSADAAYPMGSETEFCVRVARGAGAKAWFASAPQVRHIVRASQTHEAFILARAFRHGRGFARMHGPVRRGTMAKLKARARIAVLSLLARIGHVPSRWDAAWHRGFEAGMQQRSGPTSALPS